MKNQIDVNKKYTIELTLPDILHIVSTLGQAKHTDNERCLRRHMENRMEYAQNLVPIANDMLNNGFNYLGVYKNIKTKVIEINKEYKPTEEVVHFCLYRVKNGDLITSGVYKTKEEMVNQIFLVHGNSFEIIEKFSKIVKTVFK